MSAKLERCVLWWRMCRGRAAVVRHLDLLAVALRLKGYRSVRLYRHEEFPVPLPLLWVFACGPEEHAGMVVGVRSSPGGNRGYYEAGRGRAGYLAACGDAEFAADQIDALLRHMMFPAAW
ncbi:hypothetical protein [Actinomadura sp. WMMA1423]|uniref:hypothetical protein n=1 Tax=Actinomadura sp. WMMA1423 TaxID=2591108 RepID=UPI0011474E1B|nr:hypothetical protein [Actinomadura sp. WMMA1423]